MYKNTQTQRVQYRYIGYLEQLTPVNITFSCNAIKTNAVKLWPLTDPPYNNSKTNDNGNLYLLRA